MDIVSYLLGKKAGGGGASNLQNKDVSITSNGTSTISADEGYDGLATVGLNVNVQPNLETKSVTITENKTTTITPTQGKDGMSSVEVITNIPQPTGTINITQNGTTDVTNYATANVNVSVSTVEEKDVNFIDYDGTVLYAYTKDEFLALTSMPANPTHTGLTSQGWNWSLANAKTYVTEVGELYIGQLYDTDDGTTRVYVDIPEGGLDPYVGLGVNGSVTIDWGDNSEQSTLTGTSTEITIGVQHIYSAPGSYVIKIKKVDSSTYRFTGSTSLGLGFLLYGGATMGTTTNKLYASMIKKIEISSDITVLSGDGLRGFKNLETLVMPSFVNQLYSGFLYDCCKLKCVVMPRVLGSKALGAEFFRQCYSLEKVVLSDSNIQLSNNYSFNACTALKKLYINCASNLGEGVLYNTGLTKITIPSKTLNLGVDSISNNPNLHEIILYNNTANLSSNYIFRNNYALSKIVFSKKMLTISGTQLFSGNYATKYYDFSAYEQVPSLTNANSFPAISAMRSDVKFIIPDALYEDWKVANNWSTYADLMIKASEA